MKAMRLFLIICCLFSSCDGKKYELSICAIFRDEARFLKEWIEFHRMLGVEHFYLTNHLSIDHYETVLKPYIDEGVVELNHCTAEIGELSWSEIQGGTYNNTLSKASGETHWLAIIDADEFLFPVEGNSLVKFLQEYDEFAGLCVNWQMFGTNHIEKIPDHELMIESLTKKGREGLKENTRIKSIVKPELVAHCASAHFFYYLPGYYAVDENKKILGDTDCSKKVHIDKIRINHYWTRDNEYFKHKKIPSRAQIWGYNERKKAIHMKYLLNHKYDDTILRFVPELITRMESGSNCISN